jgi:TRAP-type C4-dicarboxylate transport system substrate-binding protein
MRRKKIIRFVHDSTGNIYDNPNHACASVFAGIVNTGSNGALKVEIYPGGQLAQSAKQSRWCAMV